MRALNRAQQSEVLGVLGPLGRAGVGGGVPADVLEVGHGPGVLLGMLARRADVGHVIGVDPSVEMRRIAVRSLATEIAEGRLEIRRGDAAATGLADATVDVVVSVNNVAIWPDLDAGADELRRVLRPGGRLVVSWHGGEDPPRMAHALILPADRLARIEEVLGARFDVRRIATRRCTVFDARA